jgi:hypothetical protein
MPHADVWCHSARRALITASGTLGLDLLPDLRVGARRQPRRASCAGDLRVNRVTLFAGVGYTNSRRQPNLEIDARARHD